MKYLVLGAPVEWPKSFNEDDMVAAVLPLLHHKTEGVAENGTVIYTGEEKGKFYEMLCKVCASLAIPFAVVNKIRIAQAFGARMKNDKNLRVHYHLIFSDIFAEEDIRSVAFAYTIMARQQYLQSQGQQSSLHYTDSLVTERKYLSKVEQNDAISDMMKRYAETAGENLGIPSRLTAAASVSQISQINWINAWRRISDAELKTFFMA